jgi:putative cell wall-binding protein
MSVPAVRRLTAAIAATTMIAAGAAATAAPALATPPDHRPGPAGVSAENVEATAGTNYLARIDGANRYETAVEVSRDRYPAYDEVDPGFGADVVVLSRADDFADGLAGVPLAAAKDGPLLLTGTAALWPDTRAEIQRVLAPGGTVYVLGGTGAVSAAVETEIEGLGYTVERLAGANRYETAVAVALETSAAPEAVFVTTGTTFADALAAGPAAAAYATYDEETLDRLSNGVVVLSNGSSLPAVTAEYLESAGAGAQVVAAVGGPAAQAMSAYEGVEDLVGANRYETAMKVARFCFVTTEEVDGETWAVGPWSVTVASGETFPDALSGGAYAAAWGEPLLLTRAATLPAETHAFLDAWREDVMGAVVVGGPGAVSNQVAGQVLDAIG